MSAVRRHVAATIAALICAGCAGSASTDADGLPGGPTGGSTATASPEPGVGRSRSPGTPRPPVMPSAVAPSGGAPGQPLASTTATSAPKGSPRPSPPRPASGFAVEVALPAPITETDAAHVKAFRAALASVRRAVPRLTGAAVFLAPDTDAADWVALLDASRAERLSLRIGFAAQVTESGGAESGYRPVKAADGTWELGPLGRLLACRACVTHTALAGVMLVDEPWHPTKRPAYTTADLQDLYRAALRAAAGAHPALQLQFSRELWKREGGAQTTWTDGMADGVQISALEFQDRSYQRQTLLDNHRASRRIVTQATPGRQLLSSVQVMGAKVGPSAGYYFPTVAELRQMLDDLVLPELQQAHRLDGVMLQSWDSETVSRRAGQVTLGDAVLPGQPAEQVNAARAALAALNEWLARR